MSVRDLFNKDDVTQKLPFEFYFVKGKLQFITRPDIQTMLKRSQSRHNVMQSDMFDGSLGEHMWVRGTMFSYNCCKNP